jgi:aspartate aminotransferase
MSQTDTPQLNKQLQRFQPSAINSIFSLISRLKADGIDILDLSIGEPDFNTPEHIKQAAIDAIRADNTKYTPSDGTKALKLAVINCYPVSTSWTV